MPKTPATPAVWMTFLAICFLVLLGGALRLYHLPAQPYWMDEGYTINAVLSVAEHGSTVLDSGQNYFCPLYCYPTAWVASWLGHNAFAYRLEAALAGSAAIFAVYLAGATMFGGQVGLLAAFFTAFSYWQIAWSRQARWYTLFELFVWLALWSFYNARCARKHRLWWGFITTLVTGLAILSHGLGIALPCIFFAWILFEQAVARRVNYKEIALWAAGFCIAGVGTLFFDPGVIGTFTQLHFAYELPYYANFYLRNYWLFIIFIIFYAAQKNYTKKRVETWFLLFVLAGYALPLSFLTNLVQYRYLFHLTPVFFILGAAGIFEAAALLQKQWQKILLVIAVIAAFFISGQGVWRPMSAYFLEADNPLQLTGRPFYAYVPQPNWNGAYAYIAQHQTSNDIVISSMPQFNKIFLGEPGYWLEYSYLGFASGNPQVTDGRETYVNAQVVDGLGALQTLTAKHHGYIIFDYMAAGRLPPNLLAFVKNNFTQVLYEYTNAYSQVWVYQF